MRWQAAQAMQEANVMQPPRSARVSTTFLPACSFRLTDRLWYDEQRRHRNKTPYPFPADGPGDNAEEVDVQSDCQVPLESAIYVSILDPSGEPAFKPSPTKPIPRWMHPPPAAHVASSAISQAEHRPVSVLDEHFGRSARGSPDSISTICPSKSQSRPRSPLPAMSIQGQSQSRLRDTSPSPSMISILPDMEPVQLDHKAVSFVSAEPVKRPSSRLARPARSGTTPSSAYLMLPEHPPSAAHDSEDHNRAAAELAHNRHGHTILPSSSIQPPEGARLVIDANTAYESEHQRQRSQLPGAEDCVPRRHSPKLSLQVARYLQQRRGTPPPMSSEYLDRYTPRQRQTSTSPQKVPRQPSRTPPSPPINLHTQGKVLATMTSPVIERMRRNSKAEPSTITFISADFSGAGSTPGSSVRKAQMSPSPAKSASSTGTIDGSEHGNSNGATWRWFFGRR
jgi:hypothetical protein